MKTTISITLVLIILLNTMGYYGVFLGLHFQNQRAMSKALDSGNYDALSTVTLKVPISIPYTPDQSKFERIDGQLECNGEFYRMVKQKYAKDTLTIVCVRDTQHKKIKLALADYVKTFTDKGVDSSSASKTTINFLKDYLLTFISIDSASKGWSSHVVYTSNYPNMIPSFSPKVAHPPDELG